MSLVRWIIVWRTCRQIVWIALRLFARVRWRGEENIPVEGPVVVVANHESHLDPPLVGAIVGPARACGFLARASLFRIPLYGRLIRFLGAIPLDRTGRGADGMREAITAIQRGFAVLLFPEGTRSPDGAMQTFKPGFMLLARRTRASVIPTGIAGCYEAWPRSRAFPRPFSRLAVVVGDAIPADTLLTMSPAEGAAYVQARVVELQAAARALLDAD